MKQREIWLADLNPVKGSEQKGVRPVVIVSGNAMNDHFGVCIICPISSKMKNYAGCLVLKKDNVNGLERDSEVITFQVRAISNERLISKMGELTKPQLEVIKKGLMEVLTY